MHEELKIDVQNGVNKELEMEIKVCFANPYMYKLYKEVKNSRKTIIAVSDMYIPQKYMQKLLQSCGYELDAVYVSCDYGEGKANGRLQTIAKKDFNLDTKFIHIGDNKYADIIGSKEAGWETWYYPNITAMGSPYRIRSMTSISSAFYKGNINCKLHSGIARYNLHYEYGYIYWGIMLVGFFKFLENIQRLEKFDKIIFAHENDEFLYKLYDDIYEGKLSNLLEIDLYWVKMQSDGEKNKKIAYLKNFFKGCQKVGLVVLNWEENQARELELFFKEKCDMDIHIHGVPICNIKFENKNVNSYIDQTLSEKILTEIEKMRTSSEGTKNNSNLKDIRMGICDFISEYVINQKQYGNIVKISNQDAYAPLSQAIKEKLYVIK